MPSLERQADSSYAVGAINYTVTWVLLVFLGPLGLHRFYLGNLDRSTFPSDLRHFFDRGDLDWCDR